ncbi:MAG: hypothetical protein HXY38_14785 [Chloroflexi bacterium]|nr:hypothetical protein [Chloroflexota bacterium]
MKLTDSEKREVLKLIESGRPLPDKYRLSKEPIHEWNTNTRMRAACS